MAAGTGGAQQAVALAEDVTSSADALRTELMLSIDNMGQQVHANMTKMEEARAATQRAVTNISHILDELSFRTDAVDAGVDALAAAVAANFSANDAEFQSIAEALGGLGSRLTAVEELAGVPPPPACPDQPAMRFGISVGGGNTIGSVLLHQCNPGTMLEGEAMQVCHASAGGDVAWVPAQPPKCVPQVTCRMMLDNWVGSWYVDGVSRPLDRRSQWDTLHTLNFPSTASTIAVNGADDESGCVTGGFGFICTCDADPSSKWHNYRSAPSAEGMLGYASRDKEALGDRTWYETDYAATEFSPVVDAQSPCAEVVLADCPRPYRSCEADSGCGADPTISVCPPEPAEWQNPPEKTQTFWWFRISPQ